MSHEAMDRIADRLESEGMLEKGSPFWIWKAIKSPRFRDRYEAIKMIIGNLDSDNEAVEHSPNKQSLPLYDEIVDLTPKGWWFGEHGVKMSNWQ